MRLCVALLSCMAVMLPARSQNSPVFDTDPGHPWNRLYAAIHSEERSAEEETFESREDRLLSGEHYRITLALLDEFIRSNADGKIDAPLKRAILQRTLWAAFDAASDPQGRHQSNRRALVQKFAEVIQRLALTPRELAALPDNYLMAVKSNSFAAKFDPLDRRRMFLPSDLMQTDGPWVMLGGGIDRKLAAPQHVAATQGRSAFYALMRLPGGRSQTLAYIDKLARNPTPFMWNDRYANAPYAASPVRFSPDVPQFPAGTQVALVRRMILPDSNGLLAVTPIIEGVQIRVYESGPGSTARSNPEIRATGMYEAHLIPSELLAGSSGLREVRGQQVRNSFSLQRRTLFDRGACSDCHGQNGILSVQTYVRTFGPPKDTPWFAETQRRYQDQFTLDWKQRQYSWGLLQGLWDAHAR